MIKLFHYFGNFGDSLSPYIVKKLSGEDVEYSQPFTITNYLQNFVACCKHCLSWPHDKITRNMAFTRKPLLIAIGSLIENSTDNCIIWGTGIAQPQIIPKGGQFIMTRGPLSRELLINHGYNVKSLIGGDPAILMPLLYKPKVIKKNKVGLICHNVDFGSIDKDTFPMNVNLISLKTDDIESVIDQIVSCDIIFSTSLHGLIVSHVYGIPAVWAERNQLPGGHFKFNDYFLSVGIDLYEPLSINTIINSKFTPNLEGITSLPQKDIIETIQKELIARAPFTINYKINNE